MQNAFIYDALRRIEEQEEIRAQAHLHPPDPLEFEFGEDDPEVPEEALEDWLFEGR